MDVLYLIGGSGFIGKNFVDLLDNKYDIYVFDKFVDQPFFDNYKATACQINLDCETIPVTYPEPNYIINLSSVVNTSDDLSLFDQLISSNLKVLLNLYQQYKGSNSLKLFVQFGSSEEYGNNPTPFKEEERENPPTPYALVKQLVVNTSLMLNRNYGFPIMAVRPGNLFGRFQNPRRFVPYIITQLYKGETLEVSLCEQKRDFMYINNFVYCLDKVIENWQKTKGEIINISSGKSVSLRLLIEMCAEIIGAKSVINYGAIPYKADEIMDLNCSVNKYESIIGEKIKDDLRGALEDCVSFYTDKK